MKTISTALAQHLAAEVTTLATCWKITRRHGFGLGFTDHVRDPSPPHVLLRPFQATTGASCTLGRPNAGVSWMGRGTGAISPHNSA